MSTSSYHTVTALLLSVALFSTTAEHLYNCRQMLPGRILSWPVVGVDRDVGREDVRRRAMRALMGYRAFTALLVIHGLAIVAMFVLALHGVLSATVQGVVVVGLVLVLYRNQYALDGGDQMMLIVAAALLCRALAPQSPVIASASLWFIALQSVLSYVASGVAKLAAPAWRSGEALQWVMNTETYGSRTGAALLQRRPRLAQLLCWHVMVVESLFPLALILEPPYGAIFLLWGAGFHGANVLIMGLHRFFWAFLASYPAIWFCMTERWSG